MDRKIPLKPTMQSQGNFSSLKCNYAINWVFLSDRDFYIKAYLKGGAETSAAKTNLSDWRQFAQSLKQWKVTQEDIDAWKWKWFFSAEEYNTKCLESAKYVKYCLNNDMF